VFTLECHDIYPCRVMVGKELDPKYWFSKTSFKEAYTEQIWWPHLADRAGAVGAEYGVQPMTFAVHAEYINRPSVVHGGCGGHGSLHLLRDVLGRPPQHPSTAGDAA
jgi:hypothetical protein